MNKSYFIFILQVLLISFPLQARTPENLAGTDIFSDIDLGNGKALALSNLNLCYGAELFVAHVAQALYLNGDVIRVVQELQNRGNRKPLLINKTCFYKEIVKKEELHYSQVNPLALLMRILFYQIPQTESLAKFKVSENFRFKGDKQKTIEQWAQLVAVTTRLTYEFELKIKTPNDKQPHNAFTHACLALHNSAFNKINFSDLVKRSIAHAEGNQLGVWFTVRLLIAGAYELFGHEQQQIFAFYKQLQYELLQQFRKVKVVKKEIEVVVIPCNEQFVPPFVKGFEDVTDGYQVYKLIDELQNFFEPLTHRHVTLKDGVRFSDCFETGVRNIVLRLILTNGGVFNTSLLSEKFKLFFDRYMGMSLQQKQEAYDAWAQLLVEEFRGRLWFSEGYYNLEPSLNNLLVALNGIFNLGILELENYTLLKKSLDNDFTFFSKLLLSVNAAFRSKMAAIEKDFNLIDLGGTYQDNNALDRALIVIKTPLGAMKFSILDHGDISIISTARAVNLSKEHIEKFPYFGAIIDLRQPGLPNYSMISLLHKPMTDQLLKQLLNAVRYHDKYNQLVFRMMHAAVARHYDLDQFVYNNLLLDLMDRCYDKIFKTHKKINDFMNIDIYAFDALEGVIQRKDPVTHVTDECFSSHYIEKDRYTKFLIALVLSGRAYAFAEAKVFNCLTTGYFNSIEDSLLIALVKMGRALEFAEDYLLKRLQKKIDSNSASESYLLSILLKQKEIAPENMVLFEQALGALESDSDDDELVDAYRRVFKKSRCEPSK